MNDLNASGVSLSNILGLIFILSVMLLVSADQFLDLGWLTEEWTPFRHESTAMFDYQGGPKR